MASKSKPLSQDEVLKNISLLPAGELEAAKRQFQSEKPKRHGSAFAARQLAKNGKPEVAVKPEDRKRMAKQYAYGVSYRALESIWHLKPASGNDAFRQIDNVLREDRNLAVEVKAICKRSGQTVPKAARNARKANKSASKKKAPVAA